MRRQAMLDWLFELGTHLTTASINLLAVILDFSNRDVTPKGTVACLVF